MSDGSLKLGSYFECTRGAGHTRLLVDAIVSHLGHELVSSAPPKVIVVWTWSAKEADDLRRHVRDNLVGWCDDPDVLMQYVRIFSVHENSIGIRAPCLVDNHVVIELCIEIDKQDSEIKSLVRRYEAQKRHHDTIVAQWKGYVDLLHAHIRKLEEERDVMQAHFDEEGTGP